MSAGVTRDCSVKLQGKIAEVLDRELRLFAYVLEPADIGVVMLEAAVMMVRTTAATVAGYATDRPDVEKLFRSVTADILEQVTRGEADGIARTMAALQARGDRRR